MTSRERIDRIRQSMREQGLTNQQLADMSQISASTVSRTLAGKTEPEQHTLEAMESAIGITDKPIADPAMPKGNIDQSAQLYINLMEMRISRMRAHYNMLLAEKKAMDRNVRGNHIDPLDRFDLFAYIRRITSENRMDSIGILERLFE